MAKFKVLKSHTDPKTGKQLNPGEEIEADPAQVQDRVNRGELQAGQAGGEQQTR